MALVKSVVDVSGFADAQIQPSALKCYFHIPGQRVILPSIRVHGPRSHGAAGVEDGRLHGESQRVDNAATTGRARLLPSEELPASGY